MNVEYRWCKSIRSCHLEELFCSLSWSSGQYPQKLQQAMLGSDSVYTAWVDGKLVGLMNALSDGVMIVYFHYLLVSPDYQGMGIGSHLVEGMLNRYSSLYRKVLSSYDDAVSFYTKHGFQVASGVTNVGITSWEPITST